MPSSEGASAVSASVAVVVKARASGLPSSSMYTPSLDMVNGIVACFVDTIDWGLVGVPPTGLHTGSVAVVSSMLKRAMAGSVSSSSMPRPPMEYGVASKGVAAIGRMVVAVRLGRRDCAISFSNISSRPRRVTTEDGGAVYASVLSIPTDIAINDGVAVFVRPEVVAS